MKTQTITLTHLPDILLVELPEGATNPIIDDYLLGFNLPAPVGWGDWAEESYDTVKLPSGNWRIVSTLADLTEEDAKAIVDCFTTDEEFGSEDVFRDYSDKSFYDTAIESFHSAIRASGWLLENTYPSINDPKFYDEPYDGSGFYQELYSGALDDWKQRQSRTLNPELTLILTKD